MRYKYILWDSDDTLLDFGEAEKYAFKTTMKQLGLPDDREHHLLYNSINDELWKKLALGEIKKEELVVKRFRDYLEAIGSSADPAMTNERYLTNLSDSEVLIENAEYVLAELNKMGIKNYIITNAVSRVAHKRLEGSSLMPYISDIFVSEDVGCGKPDRRYYEYTLNHIEGAKASECLAVGDSYLSDIRGGNDFGIDTCHFGRKDESCGIVATFEIESLLEILDIVKG